MTGKQDKAKQPIAASAPFRMSDHLRTDAEIAAYLEAALEDGDGRVITVALRDAAEAVGGMAVLASRTGLSRETLYRTLSAQGNPRLDTLAVLLAAFNLRLSVQPMKAA